MHSLLHLYPHLFWDWGEIGDYVEVFAVCMFSLPYYVSEIMHVMSPFQWHK